jgi:DGQHR domain-containing protein
MSMRSKKAPIKKNVTGSSVVRLPAIKIQQGRGRPVYCFAIDGKQLHKIATVSRVQRESDGTILGYQRPEVMAHIDEIRRYVESEAPLIPNAIVIAFDKTVQFKAAQSSPSDGAHGVHGWLEVPHEAERPDSELPGWIVDGQQRTAALRDAEVSHFPVFATAFISENSAQQREQFILVNSTKPLPRSLLYELLPATSDGLPSALERRRLPAILLDRLNHDQDSPLRGMIQTPTMAGGVIKDNSILRMIENSLTDGALYLARFSAADERGLVESMLIVLKTFWSACRETFPEAWGISPRKSRLMHGAGIITMGLVMDAIADRIDPVLGRMQETFSEHLGRLKPHCHWTHGTWVFSAGSTRNWSDVQNTPKDIQMLADHLLTVFRRIEGRPRSAQQSSRNTHSR